jgi:hypothetical protein
VPVKIKKSIAIKEYFYTQHKHTVNYDRVSPEIHLKYANLKTNINKYFGTTGLGFQRLSKKS